MPSKIQWTEETWNPVTGCTKISAGCKNCYAEKMAKRLQGMGQKNYANGFKVTCHEHMLRIPLDRKKPTKYFVCSMGDIAHDDVPLLFMDKVFAVAALCPQHEFIFLTKRFQRLCEYLRWEDFDPHETRRDMINAAANLITKDYGAEVIKPGRWPLPNVKIGHSVSNQDDLIESWKYLSITLAAYRIFSYEPALGAVDFGALSPNPYCEFKDPVDGCCVCDDMLTPECNSGQVPCPGAKYFIGPDGIIVGGESGFGARPMHPDWVKSVRDYCNENGVPLFFKQWGEYAPCSAKDPRVVWVTQSGKILKPESVYEKSEYPLTPMKKVGKKASGDLLDGMQYHEWPV